MSLALLSNYDNLAFLKTELIEKYRYVLLHKIWRNIFGDDWSFLSTSSFDMN